MALVLTGQGRVFFAHPGEVLPVCLPKVPLLDRSCWCRLYGLGSLNDGRPVLPFQKGSKDMMVGGLESHVCEL